MPSILPTLAAAAVLSLCGSASAQCTMLFGTPSINSPGALSINLTRAADFDGDGKLDVAMMHDTTAGVLISWGKGDGTFDAPVEIHPGPGRCMGVADMNGDGLPDLVVRDELPISIRVLLASPSRAFTAMPKAPNTGGSNVWDIATGDIDGDGRVDAAIIDRTINSIRVFLNDGAGNLTLDSTTPATPPPGMVLQEIAVTDLDASRAGSDVVTFATEGNANGSTRMNLWTFRDRNAPLEFLDRRQMAIDITEVILADLDGDGADELVGTYAAAGSAGGLVVFPPDHSGNLGPEVLAPQLFGRPLRLAAADFNGDGLPDVVCSNGGIQRYVNNGVGVLTNISSQFVPTSVKTICAGDFDRDGKADVVENFDVSPATVNFFANIGSAPPVRYLEYAVTSCPTAEYGLFMLKPAQPIGVRWENLRPSGWELMDISDRIYTPAGETFGTMFGTDTRTPLVQTFDQCCAGGTVAFVRAVATSECGTTHGPAVRLAICRADVNCDGFLDFFDSDEFVLQFEEGGVSADFNLDGFIDFFDLDAFVLAFETGC